MSQHEQSGIATTVLVVKPHPPRSLQYEMTPEGVSRISWRSPEPAPYDLQYEVRYSVNATEKTWTNVEGVLEVYATPGDLKAGLDYTAQARCKWDRRPGLWSNWSEPLYIRMQEVTYIPATVLTAAGSNVTVYCVFNNRSPSVKKVVWWLNASEKVPEKLYSVMNDHVSRVTLPNVSPSKPRGYHLLQCCQQTGETSDCNFRYAQIYAVDVNFLISCETNGYQTSMTCKWNPNGIELPQGSSVRFMYRIRNDISCDALQDDLHGADAKECQLGVHDECTFQPLYLYFCHIMWIEIHYKLVTLRSHPANVTPMDVVKPDPPFNVKAEITRTEGFLNMSWERRELPVYDLQFEVRYSGEELDRKWKTLGNVYNEQALMEVADPCVVYVVQVRCKRHNGTGHWSTWSSPVNTRVNDIRVVMLYCKTILKFSDYSLMKTFGKGNKDPPDCGLSKSFTSSANTLGVDLRRGRRRYSGNLQLPPLSWRQAERARTPEEEFIPRPTTLPFIIPPRIDITPVDPEW
ncbi:UNVERIFIED_CONTAM: hypothetical protein FKN15_068421 [Acipenser sinensis]